MRAPVYGLAGGDQRANVSLHSITIRETEVALPRVICERGVPLGNSAGVLYLCCACAWRRRNPCLLGLHRMLGTTEMGLEGLDAFLQMSRRQMCISQGHSDVAVPSQGSNLC